MEHIVLAVLAFIAITSAQKEQTRWSRQISSYTSDIGDWVPLKGPVESEIPQIKRQAVAEPRILSEPFSGFTKPTGFSQDEFESRAFYNPPANRHLYLQSVPSAPQNYLSDQGFNQGLRFGLTQPNYPLSQGFITPQFSFDSVPQFKTRPQIISNPIKFDNVPKVKVPVTNLVKPLSNQAPKLKPETPKFVDGYRLENTTSNFLKKKPQSLQKVKFDTDKSREILSAPKSNLEREEVQLLYVPLESLNRGQFNFRSPLTSAQLLNTELYNQNTRTNAATQNFADLHNPMLKQLDNFNSQEFLANYSPIREVEPARKFSTTTTPYPITSPTTAKPKKLKPHQPPLAIFLTQDAKKDDQVKVGDVLYTLKNANTVAVLDSVNPLNAPSVFIGPSSLTPPKNYVKFELPYLSNIENTDKKLRQLPFFVAPLSYNTPQGFAKIPFPSPHVGSVVINSQMKDTSTTSKATIMPDVYTNSYSRPTSYRQDQKPVTQKPVISYYTTSTPNINSPNYEQNYYSIEPQTVNSLPSSKEQETKLISQQPSPIKTGSYFLHNMANQQRYNQYNQQFVNFPQETNYKTQEPPKTVNVIKPETTTTPRNTPSTSTAQTPPTYPNQLLETHNPYSINQAFSFSTPLDYHNFFDEYKEAYVTPGSNQSPPSSSIPNGATPVSTNTRKPELTVVNEQSHQSSPNNMKFYSPEIHNLPENHNLRYPVFNTNDYYTKTESPRTETTYTVNAGQINENTQTTSHFQKNVEYNDKVETQSPKYENHTENIYNEQISKEDIQTTKAVSEYNQFDVNSNLQETHVLEDSSSSSTSTSTTTTRRTTLRSRGRPRYPTAKPDSSEYSTRATVTRRPLRERKTLPPRSKYEPNKITTERVTRKPIDLNESTTKSTRYRTRGRVQFKPSDADELFSKRNKDTKKEQDLAYQRDVLHQNYPVTLMERTSTVDIEAITEPSEKESSLNNQQSASIKLDDTEDAYSDKISITDNVNEEFKVLSPLYTAAEDSQTGASHVPKIPVHNEEFFYQAKTSELRQENKSGEEIKDEELPLQSSVEQNPNYPETGVATISDLPVTEENFQIEHQDSETQTIKPEELTTPSDENEENTKDNSHETSQEQEHNVIETTPSYNRVRIRPGVIRKYHQSSSSELSRTKTDRRKPLQPITYRPAFDRRRTTMRIEEIEADLKTKQIHTRPEFQNYRQPIYKPEPSTEASTTPTTESSTKRNQFRRRRPSYGTTSTESTATRRPYEGKNRFRGRRPADKTTEKTESQSEMTTTTIRNTIHNRYANRPRLSERYNKNPEVEEATAEDQDPNYSINVPRYMEPEANGWSPKISQDSFKPYNPNHLTNEPNTSSLENKSNVGELDIITAKNEYEDILISVTPATNKRINKKLPDVPPTIEALVEQSKATKGDSGNAVSTFETMLEEVMKSLEEQDENEYTNKVIKHKGGEIGEIPPERIISSGENYSAKTTFPQEVTTQQDDATFKEDDIARKNRRRGFWKKVKVHPATESIDVAESQYYSKTVNQLGQSVSKNSLEKPEKSNTKLVVTTYKPDYQFLKDFFESEEDHDGIPDIEITKLTEKKSEEFVNISTKSDANDNFTEKVNPGEMDLGTGSPDPTFDDSTAYIEPTEPAPSDLKSIDRSDGFSFMDYLFGVTSSEGEFKNESKIIEEDLNETTKPSNSETENGTEATKLKATTESEYFPYEFTADNTVTEIDTEKIPSNDISDDAKMTERPLNSVENSSKSSFMDPSNVVSTSMSTEVSHETEICFRGKCIKTNKDMLL